MTTVRDGLRWHLIEKQPGLYDWTSWVPMLRAARSTRTQVIWDLCHYGWPDDIDIWSEEFVDRFAAFSAAATQVARDECDDIPFFCPINEISYWAWAGGETGKMNPGTLGRGAELKQQLVRAYLACMAAVRRVDRRARFLTAEPLIHVSPCDGALNPRDAERYRLAQFEAHDMLYAASDTSIPGLSCPLDIVGVNFYPDNQWYLDGSTIPLGHHAYRPLADMLAEVFERYQRPLFLSETGSEGNARPYWLHHVCAEVSRAIATGIPIVGICLYPISDYRGWENDRECPVGMFSLPDTSGHRRVHFEFAAELKRQMRLMGSMSTRVPLIATMGQ